MLLENKVAVIHGGGGSIGGAAARVFAREGARLFLAGKSLRGSRPRHPLPGPRGRMSRSPSSTRWTRPRSTGTSMRWRMPPAASTSR